MLGKIQMILMMKNEHFKQPLIAIEKCGIVLSLLDLAKKRTVWDKKDENKKDAKLGKNQQMTVYLFFWLGLSIAFANYFVVKICF